MMVDSSLSSHQNEEDILNESPNTVKEELISLESTLSERVMTNGKHLAGINALEF